MSLRLFLVLLALLWPAAAVAHRLDEYLQATTIAVGRDQATLRLSLTPGVSVAPDVLARIDSSRDGWISPIEQRRYAERVSGGLELSIDGRPVGLQLRSWSFPAASAIRAGGGDIVLDFVAPLSPGRQHRIVLDRRYRDRAAIYLVNTLVPADPTVAILAQHRSIDQSRYTLDFAVGERRVPTSSPGRAAVPGTGAGSSRAAITATFLRHGVRHILTGYDHLLFLAALVLGAATLWDLIKVVTAFTVAHSLTLTLAALGLVHVSDALVEPVIAGSIVAVAFQNVFWPAQARRGGRLALAFLFGLFHGLGFAGGLLEVMHAMPGAVILSAILGFSLGVEAGNQVVLLPLFGATRLLGQAKIDNSDVSLLPLVQQIGSAGIAAAGLFYFVSALLRELIE